MTNKTSNESRRKLLKSIAAGSGVVIAGKSLPESWSRPIVHSVLLPAHAQTSTCPVCRGAYCFSFLPAAPVFLFIDVSGLQIFVEVSTPGGLATGTGTADCDSFTIIATGGQNPDFTVSGTIATDCAQVTGMVIANNINAGAYTATNTNCN